MSVTSYKDSWLRWWKAMGQRLWHQLWDKNKICGCHWCSKDNHGCRETSLLLIPYLVILSFIVLEMYRFLFGNWLLTPPWNQWSYSLSVSLCSSLRKKRLTLRFHVISNHCLWPTSLRALDHEKYLDTLDGPFVCNNYAGCRFSFAFPYRFWTVRQYTEVRPLQERGPTMPGGKPF